MENEVVRLQEILPERPYRTDADPFAGIEASVRVVGRTSP